MCSKNNWTSEYLGACLEDDRACFDFLLILCAWTANKPKQNKLEEKLAVMSIVLKESFQGNSFYLYLYFFIKILSLLMILQKVS